MRNGDVVKLLKSPFDELPVVVLNNSYYRLDTGERVESTSIRVKTTSVNILEIPEDQYVDLTAGWRKQDPDSELVKWGDITRASCSGVKS